MIKLDINKNLHGSNGDMLLEFKTEINQGDFIALTGLSGSGKTTVLRILAGLEESDSDIQILDHIWQDNKSFMPPQQREIGFVFQDYALFENMTILENLYFVQKDEILANRLLEITNLKNLKNRYPKSLSGGQKQRVSLCRALMKKPKILLLDEPLSALDPKMRLSLQSELLTLHKEFKTTTIMVSHEPSEIYKLANRVIVLNNGKIINDGSPNNVLLKTTGSAKFSFTGEILDIVKTDIVNVAIIAIGQQLVEIVLSQTESKNYKIGDTVNISTKAFAPSILS